MGAEREEPPLYPAGPVLSWPSPFPFPRLRECTYRMVAWGCSHRWWAGFSFPALSPRMVSPNLLAQPPCRQQELKGRRAAQASQKSARGGYGWGQLAGDLEPSWTVGIPTLPSGLGQIVRSKPHHIALKRHVWIEFGNLIRA